jgi:hypothetical protein
VLPLTISKALIFAGVKSQLTAFRPLNESSTSVPL